MIETVYWHFLCQYRPLRVVIAFYKIGDSAYVEASFCAE